MSAPKGAGGGFTPGPWRYTPWHIEEGNPTVRAPEGWLICETSSDANARLIAAAPDLLTVVRYAVDNPEFDSAEFDRMARAALARVQGGAA